MVDQAKLELKRRKAIMRKNLPRDHDAVIEHRSSRRRACVKMRLG